MELKNKKPLNVAAENIKSEAEIVEDNKPEQFKIPAEGKVINKKEAVIKKEYGEKEKNKGLYDINYRFKLTDNINYRRHLSGKGRIEDIMDRIIEAVVGYKRSPHNKDLIRVSSVILGIEQDEDSWFDSLRFLKPMQDFGCFKNVWPDRFDYVFEKPNLEKLKEYRAKIKQELSSGDIETTKKDRPLIEFGRYGDDWALKITNFDPLPFQRQTLRWKIINFFYNSENRKEWQTYGDIQTNIPDSGTHDIRDAINDINQRVFKHTGGEYSGLIEVKSNPDKPKAPRMHRWKY